MREQRAEPVDDASFNAAPALTYRDNDVAIQHEAVAACRQVGDRLGEARARNMLGLLCLRHGYHSSARTEFETSLRILADLGDDQWIPVIRMHVAECMIGVALYQEAREILAKSLAVFRERGDTENQAEALRLLREIQDTVERWATRPGPVDPVP